MIQINPREIAAEALMEIMKEDAYNNMVLKRLLRQNGAMSPKDRAFVTEIVNGTLRNLYYIDYILNKISTVKTEKMKPWILAVLRSAVYQIYFMKVPDSAACNEAVELVKEKGFGKLTGFVNGVLRNVLRKKDEISFPDEKTTPVDYLSVRYSHPKWLIQMWLHAYGYDFVKALCEKNNEAPDVTICYNTLKTEKGILKQELEQQGVSVKEGIYYRFALHLTKTADMGALDTFLAGHFHVQDESSMTAVEVLSPKPGERILDICAAPGGKSFLVAEKMENLGEVVSRDIYEHKQALIEEGAERLGISIITAEMQDASEEDQNSVKAFDRVLVDAPCSGLGLIRKKPDICLRKNGNDIDELMLLQRKILGQAAAYVKEGGVLVYSTCTICKKENLNNIQWFLANHKEYQLEDITAYLPEGMKSDTAEKGYIQLFPHIHGTDGFFIARMRREEQQNDGKA